MATVLRLRSSDGKVMVAPRWDRRPSTAQALPMETGVPSRALEKILQCWTKHALAAASGEPRDSLARWDADFARRLGQDGLTAEVASAARKLRLNGVHHGGRPPAASSATRPCAATRPDPATSARAAGPDTVRPWRRLVQHLRFNGGRRPVASSASSPRAPRPSDVAVAAHADPVVSPDRAAVPRARGRQRAEEENESACHHRKHSTATSRPLPLKACSSVRSAPGTPRLPAPAGAPVKKVTAAAQLHPSKPATSSLRARRGLPELSCKCPQQNPLRGTSRNATSLSPYDFPVLLKYVPGMSFRKDYEPFKKAMKCSQSKLLGS